MNIFFTDLNPGTAALALDDKRLNKMILETAQLLSSAIAYAYNLVDNNGKPVTNPTPLGMSPLPDDKVATLYKVTHWNHPSSKFARSSHNNFVWLYKYFVSLAMEKQLRTALQKKLLHNQVPQHLSYVKIAPLAATLVSMKDILADTTLTEADILPYMAVTPELAARYPNAPITAYRAHLNIKWINDAKPKWTQCNPPQWATKGIKNWSTL